MSWPFPIQQQDAEGWPMHQFCVYENPADAKPGYPYVVRRWAIGEKRKPGFCSVRPCEAMCGKTLDDVRSLIPPGMVLTMPSEDDDPCIREVWM